MVDTKTNILKLDSVALSQISIYLLWFLSALHLSLDQRDFLKRT